MVFAAETVWCLTCIRDFVWQICAEKRHQLFFFVFRRPAWSCAAFQWWGCLHWDPQSLQQLQWRHKCSRWRYAFLGLCLQTGGYSRLIPIIISSPGKDVHKTLEFKCVFKPFISLIVHKGNLTFLATISHDCHVTLRTQAYRIFRITN